MIKKIIGMFILIIISNSLFATAIIKPGAEQLNAYLPLLKNKRVAVFANHSSFIGNESLVDVLLNKQVHVIKIFAPEHGFRGEEDDRIKDSVDYKTGLPIISL